MKLLSTLVQTTHKLTMGILTIIPLLIIAPQVLAETENPVEFSQSELDQMLAPIALYPDTVLSQVLIASTYPLEIIQADRWARTNSSVKGADAVKMVDNKDWDPSVKALVAFPDILQKMSEDVDWTQRLGDAFLSSEEQVMDTVQRLRKRAYASGSLDKVQHLKVEHEDNQIIIEPAEERVVYVPVYDTRVVYGNWWWPEYPPVYWHYPSSYVYVSGFYWGSSIYVGPSFFYSSCGWHQRRVVVVDYHNHYNDGPHFYTSRSIVTYHGAREWHHDPVHRRGVAYYNDNLRNSYGSRHESYRNDHVYREQHRDNYTPTHPTRAGEEPRNNPRIIQSQEREARVNNNGANNNHVSNDRAEQLRERMGRQAQDANNGTNNRSPNINGNNGHNSQQIDRSFSRTQNDVRTPTETRTQNDLRPPAEARAQYEATNRARNETNTVQRETSPQPQNVQREAPRNEAPRNVERNDANNNRPVRVDDSMTRQAPRAERSGGDNGNSRAGRHGRDDDKRD